MNKRLITLTVIAGLILVYSLYYWGTPKLINLDKNSKLITELIEKQSGFKTEFVKAEIKMSLLPSIWVFADEFSILNANNSKPLIIKNPTLKVDILPLIFGKVHIKYFSADKFYTNLYVGTNSKFYLGDYLIESSKPTPINFDNSKIFVDSYHIDLSNKIKNTHVKILGEYFNLDKFVKNKRIKLATAAKFIVNNNPKSNINIDIDLKLPIKKHLTSTFPDLNVTVTNLNLSDYTHTINYFSKGLITDANGVINLEMRSKAQNNVNNNLIFNFVCSNLKINYKNLSKPFIYNDKIEILSSFNSLNDGLIINKLNFNAKNAHLNLTGVIKKLDSKNPILNIAIESKKTRSEDLIKLFPNDKKAYETLNDIKILKLIQYPLYGDVNMALSIKGKAPEPDLNGFVNITDAYLIKPIKNAPKAFIKINFRNREMILDSRTYVSPTEYVDVKEPSNLYDSRTVNLLIRSTKNVNLEVVQNVLIPLHQILSFELGPVPIMKIKGTGEAQINIQGNKNDPKLFGYFKFKNASASFNFLPQLWIKKGNAILTFKKADTYFTTQQAFLNDIPIKIQGTADFIGNLNFKVYSEKQDLSTLFNSFKSSFVNKSNQQIFNSIKALKGSSTLNIIIKGKVKNINEFKIGKNVFINGDVLINSGSLYFKNLATPIDKINGKISLLNNDARINLTSFIENSKLLITGNVNKDNANINIASKKLYFEDALSLFANEKFELMKKDSYKKPDFINFNATYNGSITKFNLNNLKSKSNLVIKDTLLYYKPTSLPILIVSGNLNLDNTTLKINKLNARIADTPFLLDGSISNIFDTPHFKLYFNSKPTQEIIDKVFNKREIYPLKIKGDISLFSDIDGTAKEFTTKSKINLAENASIYYIGATIGDAFNPVDIILNAKISPNAIKINNFYYDKIIKTNKDVVSRQLAASGNIRYLKDNVYFNDFRIKTQTPTDIKIFNIIFKKPLIKKGLFESDLKISGCSKSPVVLGPISVKGIDIPFLGTTINDIDLNFQPKTISLNSKGEIFSNKFELKGMMENKLSEPYIINDLSLYISNLNLNRIIEDLKLLEVELAKQQVSQNQKRQKNNFNLNKLIIKNAELKSDKTALKNINARDFQAEMSLTENNTLNVDNFKFNIAEGTISGQMNYTPNNDLMHLGLNVHNINANLISEALFDLKNQIYGELNGAVNLSCNASSHKACMQTLDGNGHFEVNQGKLPKLGSLEYLLKAGNLVKSGVTGLSVNNLIELVAPLKTGEFAKIKGHFHIADGVADNIKIYSYGKDLNIFLTGTYNFSMLIAEMSVYGRLAKHASNILGPIGNASLNALFNLIPGVNLTATENRPILNEINKIPGLELNNKAYRIFIVEILGDINGDNYVKSFRWLE